MEIPELKRCCFCLPLRYGLLVWSYLLLIPMGHYSVEFFIIIQNYIAYHFEEHWFQAIMYTVGFLVLMVNIGLTFLIIVAAHKKSVKLLKVYYKYALLTAIATFASEIMWLANITVYYVAKKVTSPVVWKHMTLRLIFEVVSLVQQRSFESLRRERVNILLGVMSGIGIYRGLCTYNELRGVKLYVLRLVKSEILKLEKNSQFQFSNIAAEAEIAYNEPNTNIIVLENVTAEKMETNKSMEEKHDNGKINNNVLVYTDTQEDGPK